MNGGLTALAFAGTSTSISIAQFNTEGGTFTDNCSAVTTIAYLDVASSTCPVVVTRTFTLNDGCGNTVHVHRS